MATKVNRRDFLNNLGVIGAVSSVPWLSTNSMASNLGAASNVVNVGVIGVGSRGRALLLNLMQVPGISVIAACDNYQPHFERCEKILDGKGKVYKDYRKLLENRDLDAVVIATPLYNHAEITLASMDAGMHVFCEKTLAKTVEECNAMRDMAISSNKLLQPGHQRLFNPEFMKGLDLIKNGTTGDIKQIRACWHRHGDWRRAVPSPELERKINWRMYREYSLGLMTELACHHIQVANWVMGEAPIEVSGSGSINYWKDGREVYDNVNLVYKYANGTHLIYDSMICNKHYGCEIQVMGDNACLEMEAGKIFLEEPPKPAGITQLINDIEHNFFDAVPIGGASWVPELGSDTKGSKYYDKAKGEMEDTQLQFFGFADMVREDKCDMRMLKEGYNAAIGTILGDTAMVENRIIKIGDDIRL